MLELAQETAKSLSGPTLALCLGISALIASVFDSDRQRRKIVASLSVLVCVGAVIVILSA